MWWVFLRKGKVRGGGEREIAVFEILLKKEVSRLVLVTVYQFSRIQSSILQTLPNNASCS